MVAIKRIVPKQQRMNDRLEGDGQIPSSNRSRLTIVAPERAKLVCPLFAEGHRAPGEHGRYCGNGWRMASFFT
jgi:hypothetical protein